MRLGKVLSMLAFMLVAPAAGATIIYDWSGRCTVGCNGTATASLYLDDSYVPGTALTPFSAARTTAVLGIELFMPSNGVRPSYSASLMSPAHSIYGSVVSPLWLPDETGTGAGTMFWYGGFMASSFSMTSDGSWQFGNGLNLSSACSEALSPWGCSGTSSEWVRRAVPAPGTGMLLALGLLALAGARSRKAGMKVLQH